MNCILLCVACLGVSSVVSQVVLLREFLAVFSGNELVVGLFLGLWMFLTGIGGWLGRLGRAPRDPVSVILTGQAAIAFLPPFQVAALRAIKQWFVPGVMFGAGDAMTAAAIVILPYGLLCGYLLTVFSSRAPGRGGAAQIGDVYVIDTVGSVAGGLLFSFALAHFFTAFQSVLFLTILQLSVSLATSMAFRRWAAASLLACALLATSTVVRHVDLERLTGRWAFPDMTVLHQKITPYGQLTVAQSGGQMTVFANGVPMGSSGDPITAEESVHYALAEHPAPRKVLMISGGVTGALGEVAKHPVERLDYVEPDPAGIEIVWMLAPKTPMSVRFFAEDGRMVVRRMREEYDAVIVNLPDPASAQLNRFYTQEFFAEARRAMRPGGVLSCGLSGAENYAGPSARHLASSVHRALSAVFPNVIIVPGSRMYMLASDRPMDMQFAARLATRNVTTAYVNEDYLSGKLTPDRLSMSIDMVSAPAPPNRDLEPGGYYAHLRYWLGHFNASWAVPVVFIAGAIFILGVFLLRASLPEISAAMGTTGFCGIGIEVVLILAFQTVHGNVYRHLGTIVAAFMAGASFGSLRAGTSERSRAQMLRTDASMAVFALVLGPAISAFHRLGPSEWVWVMTFPLLTALAGYLTGAQFTAAARVLCRDLRGEDASARTASHLYAVDMVGSSLGAIAVSAFLVPMIGPVSTCVVLGGVKCVTTAALWLRREKTASSPRRMFVGEALAYGTTLAIFAVIGVAILSGPTASAVYSMSFLPSYHWFLFALVLFGLISSMDLGIISRIRPLAKISDAVFEYTNVRILRWINFAGFSLVVFYPIFRCYFKIPYLFCHVCPRKCVFGYLRPYLIPAALIMNLQGRRWCHHACPIGTMYDCQSRVSGSTWVKTIWTSLTGLAALAFIVVSYFKVVADAADTASVRYDWYTYFFQNRFDLTVAVLVSAVVLILTAFRLRRVFCEMLCPIGQVSEWYLKSERKLTTPPL